MAINWSNVKWFNAKEFSQPDAMNPKLIQRLDWLRGVVKEPIFITSSIREGSKSHGEGDEVDIADNLVGGELASRWRYKVLRAVFNSDFTRVGVYNRHVHLDVARHLDQYVCWWGESH